MASKPCGQRNSPPLVLRSTVTSASVPSHPSVRSVSRISRRSSSETAYGGSRKTTSYGSAGAGVRMICSALPARTSAPGRPRSRRSPGPCGRRGRRPPRAGRARRRGRAPPGRRRRNPRTGRGRARRPAGPRAGTARWRTGPRAHGRRWGGCRFPAGRPVDVRRPCRRSRGSFLGPCRCARVDERCPLPVSQPFSRYCSRSSSSSASRAVRSPGRPVSSGSAATTAAASCLASAMISSSSMTARTRREVRAPDCA